jgi:UPF0716 protein FxsA
MRIGQPQIELPKWIAIGLAAWCIAEICVFTLIVSVLGIGSALLLGLLTSLLGFWVLRRLGRDAAVNLRQIVNTRGLVLNAGSLVDGSLAALGAVLLILPGFLSDCVGLALSVPAVRFWFASKIKSTRSQKPKRRYGPDPVIDLGTGEWRRIDEAATDLPSHP